MRAALYLRSSKDRHDVSLDAQRRDLQALAKAKQHRVVAEFADAVESGKDDDRQGFRDLIEALRNPRRGWDTLLVLDTSRIARRRHLAMMFERECEKHQVRLVYKSLPETDPITEMLLKSILQAMDEWHSLTSRQKGLAGMRENVQQGFRAGGRAPLGYRLEYTDTGKVRDGQPVRKSRLVLSGEAPLVQAFLRARAQGVPVPAAMGALAASKSSLTGVEWNALTYAGHTVWNVHAEAGSGRKRRPRSEWIVQRDTHEALITDAEAEAILTRLESWSANRQRDRGAGYLLAGLLTTPQGIAFHGDRGAYRVKGGRQIKAAIVDQVVAEHVLRDIQSPGFVRAVTAAARATRKPDGAGKLREAVADAEARIARMTALLERTTTPEPILRQIEAVEAERLRVAQALAEAEREASERAALSRITEHEVRRLLVERATEIESADPEAMRQVFTSLLSRVELDGDDLAVHYRIGRPVRGGRSGLTWRPHGDQPLNRSLDIRRRYKIA